MLVMSLASGCMWSRVQVNDPTVVDRSHGIKEGVTAESELDAILQSKPTMRMPGNGKETLAYSFSDTKHNGLMLIVVNFTRSTTVAETLYVEVDSDTRKVRKVYRPKTPGIEWRFWPFGED